MQTSLIINTTDSAGKRNQTIAYINPALDNGAAHEFGRQLAALSTNIFQGVSRLDKNSLDEDKLTVELLLSRNDYKTAEQALSRAEIKQAGYLEYGIEYAGDGELSVDLFAESGKIWTVAPRIIGDKVVVYPTRDTWNSLCNRQIVVRAAATDKYNAAQAIITLQD